MVEKVKVSREVANSIQYALEQGAKESLLIYHTNNFYEDGSLRSGVTWTAKEYLGLNQLTPERLAIALYVGYEIGETPEETLLDRYNQNAKNRIKAIQNKEPYQEGYTLGYSLGVLDGLNFANKKIKGIND